MQKIKLCLHWIDTINEWIGKGVGFLIIPITLIITLEVILRYVFNRPTIWAWDVSLQLAGALAILTGGYVLLKEGHVAVDAFVMGLSPKSRAIISMITFSLFFIGTGGLLYQGIIESWGSVMTSEHSGSYFDPPVYPLKILVPIGAFILLLQGLAKFIRDLTIVIESRRR